MTADIRPDTIAIADHDVATRRRAVRTVAANAHDAADAHVLLDALHLHDTVADLGAMRAIGRGDAGTPP